MQSTNVFIPRSSAPSFFASSGSKAGSPAMAGMQMSARTKSKTGVRFMSVTIRCGERQPSPPPILELQSRDAAELTLVVRDERQPARDGLRRDERIQRTDRRAGALQLRAYPCIRDRIKGGELLQGYRTKKVLDQVQRPCRSRDFRCACAKLGFRHHADYHIVACV